MNPHEYPWLVSLARQGMVGMVHICGGTLLNSRTVLTAAHCLYADVDSDNRRPIPASVLLVYAGVHHLSYIGAQETGVLYYENHPGYNPWLTGSDNDYSLLFLNRNIMITPRIVEPACLSIPSDAAFVPVIAAGWGNTEAGENSQIPKHVRLETINRNTCQQQVMQIITENMICTNGWASGACSGDSGGPLMDMGTKKVIGVASFVGDIKVDFIGRRTCSGPSVYAKVTSELISWIQTEIHPTDLCAS